MPKVLVQTKTDLIQQPNQQAQMELAKELGGQKQYKQISAVDKNFHEATDVIIQISLDPRKGLTDASLDFAKAQGDSGFLEYWLGVSPQSLAVGTVVVAGIAAAGFQYYKKSKVA